MLNAIQMGVLTASTKERLEKLEMQREELKLSILQAQMARPRYTKEQVVSWISRFKYGNVDDPQYQKQIIDMFINFIYVFDDKLVFTYNFKDGTETITLAEIQADFGSDLTQVAPPQNGRKRMVMRFLPFFFWEIPDDDADGPGNIPGPPADFCVSIRKQRRGEVAVAGIRQQDHNGLARIFRPLCQLDRRPDGSACRNAHEDSLCLADLLTDGKGVLIFNRDDLVIDLRIQHLGDKASADALDLMRTRNAGG